MGYRIELFLNYKNTRNNISHKENIIKNALNNDVIRYFSTIEISGRRNTIHKNFSILTLIFPEDEKNIINFIKYIKSIKKNIIETISYDNCIFRMIYSKKKKINTELLNETDKKILNSLK